MCFRETRKNSVLSKGNRSMSQKLIFKPVGDYWQSNYPKIRSELPDRRILRKKEGCATQGSQVVICASPASQTTIPFVYAKDSGI